MQINDLMRRDTELELQQYARKVQTTVRTVANAWKALRAQLQLQKQVGQNAERVRQSGRPLTLEPMGAYERRIVHLALRADPTVYTESSGEGENRKIVIFPAKS